VQLPTPLLEAMFLERLNRFAVSVEMEGETVTAHLPNSGRLTELLVPGARALLVRCSSKGRRTLYDLLLIHHGSTWVSVDARLPNHLFREAVEGGHLAEWQGFEIARSEVRVGNSRLDFLLQRTGAEGPPVWVEVKSVTLVRGECGLFPDAVTARGTRHLEELAVATHRGEQAAVVFVIQRQDARRFRPHWEADPVFAQKLARVAREGVRVLAYRCQVSPGEVWIISPVQTGPIFEIGPVFP